MNKKTLGAVAIATLVLPVLAFAQISATPPSSTSFTDLTGLGNKIVQQIWVVFTVIAVICFVVAGILFLTSGGDPDKITKARSAFIWGVAGVIVGVLAYTIIALVRGAIGAG